MPPKPQSKPQKKAANQAVSPKDRIIDAGMALASVQAWETISIRDIADEAGVELADFYDHFEDKTDLLVAYGRRLDRKVMEAFPEANPETSARDALFDIMMERYDLANRDKKALKSIIGSFRLDPKQGVISFPYLAASMAKMLEVAGLDSSGWKGAARIAGLTAAAAWITRVWLEDNSPDLPKTMAALDKALSRIENLADRFNL